jgi:uncharacterized protein (TIGR02145 family)
MAYLPLFRWPIRAFSYIFLFSVLNACVKEFKDGTYPDLTEIEVVEPASPYVDTLPYKLKAQFYTGEADPTEYGFCISANRELLEQQIIFWKNGNGNPGDVENIRVVKSATLERVNGKDYWQKFENELPFAEDLPSGLQSPRLLWHVVAFARNKHGVSFSPVALIDLCGKQFKSDVDGYPYQSVSIGQQCWMQSNLRVSKYRNGDNIIHITDDTQWSRTNTSSTGAWCNYNNDANNGTIYGKLYNWYAVNDSRGLCPTGWHLPTDGDWTTLENHLDGTSVAGSKIKSTAGWSNNGNGTNSSGFTALPGGYRDSSGRFFAENLSTYWWVMKNEPWFRSLNHNNEKIDAYNSDEAMGFSVRCIRDENF